MIRVPQNRTSIEGVSSDVAAFWMDRFEVSNRQFKAFVDAGGYRTRHYWKEPLVEDGRPVTWEDALARFLDKTGRQGPSTWELGTFPQGQAEYPVSGVSWYEAAAFAVFAGKSVPTAFQWRTATDFAGPSGVSGDILLHSNFGTNGPAALAASRHRTLRSLRHGGQRQGVVLERIARRPDDPWRRLERADLYV